MSDHAAQLRENDAKLHALRLPADRTNVFATPAEFKTHHESEPKL